MEFSKKTRVLLGLVILAGLSFSRIAKMPDVRTVDMLYLLSGGACLGALVTLLVQRNRS
jgi:hypothetical protein